MSGIHVGDIGTEIILKVLDRDKPIDLTGATVKIIIKKPLRQVIEKDATIIDAENGIVSYIVEDDLWQVKGVYTIYVIVRFDEDRIFHSDEVKELIV